jgi:hypothetical protein
MVSKRIVCLAKSRKHGGRCVAGREIVEGSWGPWVRPVSKRPGHEISIPELRYGNGSEAALADVVTVHLEGHAPQGFQPENWVLANGAWAHEQVVSWAHIRSLAENLPPSGPTTAPPTLACTMKSTNRWQWASAPRFA